MPRIFVTCSMTNAPVWTGVTVDSRRDLETIEGPVNSFACPECIHVHEWTVEDAYLDGEPMKPPPGDMDRADEPQDEDGGELAGKA